MLAWWLSIGGAGRRDAAGELDFALRVESARCDELRCAAGGGPGGRGHAAPERAGAPRRRLIEEIPTGTLV